MKKRNDFERRFVFAAGAAALLPGMTLFAAERSQPNILVVMTDDQGVGDVGYNNPLVKTPSIDRLAEQAAVFTDFTSCPLCAPARVSFLTGRNYMSAGTWGVGPCSFIREDETLLPEYLNRAGYSTAHFGKWDEGWTPDQRAYLRGYDVAGMLGGYIHRNPAVALNGVEKKVTGWTVDVLADLTIDFIRKQTAAGNPWFAVTAYISPHGPWECASEYSEPFKAAGYSDSLSVLYGMIQQMDAATGRILEELDRLGITDNTIVVYLSDNGATPCERLELSTPFGSEDWKRRNSLGLAGLKSSVWENGIRIPFLLKWPGSVPPGRRNQMCAMEDVLPTLLDLAGVSPSIVPDHLTLDGASFKSVLLDPDAPAPDRWIFRTPSGFGAPGYVQTLSDTGILNDPDHDDGLQYDQVRTMVRGPRFKYFHFERWFKRDKYAPALDFHPHADGKYALFDMKADSLETNDVAASWPELTDEMAQYCRAEWDELIAGRRCFRMPVFLIGDPRYEGIERVLSYAGANEIIGSMARQVFGSVTCPFSGCTGFTEAGDAAVFAIDVRTAGRYEVTLKGRNVHSCAPLTIEIAGKALQPQKTVAGEVAFGGIDLAVGTTDLKVIAGEPLPSAVSATIRAVILQPVDRL